LVQGTATTSKGGTANVIGDTSAQILFGDNAMLGGVYVVRGPEDLSNLQAPPGSSIYGLQESQYTIETVGSGPSYIFMNTLISPYEGAGYLIDQLAGFVGLNPQLEKAYSPTQTITTNIVGNLPEPFIANVPKGYISSPISVTASSTLSGVVPSYRIGFDNLISSAMSLYIINQSAISPAVQSSVIPKIVGSTGANIAEYGLNFGAGLWDTVIQHPSNAIFNIGLGLITAGASEYAAAGGTAIGDMLGLSRTGIVASTISAAKSALPWAIGGLITYQSTSGFTDFSSTAAYNLGEIIGASILPFMIGYGTGKYLGGIEPIPSAAPGQFGERSIINTPLFKISAITGDGGSIVAASFRTPTLPEIPSFSDIKTSISDFASGVSSRISGVGNQINDITLRASAFGGDLDLLDTARSYALDTFPRDINNSLYKITSGAAVYGRTGYNTLSSIGSSNWDLNALDIGREYVLETLPKKVINLDYFIRSTAEKIPSKITAYGLKLNNIGADIGGWDKDIQYLERAHAFINYTAPNAFYDLTESVLNFGGELPGRIGSKISYAGNVIGDNIYNTFETPLNTFTSALDTGREFVLGGKYDFGTLQESIFDVLDYPYRLVTRERSTQIRSPDLRILEGARNFITETAPNAFYSLTNYGYSKGLGEDKVFTLGLSFGKDTATTLFTGVPTDILADIGRLDVTSKYGYKGYFSGFMGGELQIPKIAGYEYVGQVPHGILVGDFGDLGAWTMTPSASGMWFGEGIAALSGSPEMVRIGAPTPYGYLKQADPSEFTTLRYNIGGMVSSHIIDISTAESMKIYAETTLQQPGSFILDLLTPGLALPPETFFKNPIRILGEISPTLRKGRTTIDFLGIPTEGTATGFVGGAGASTKPMFPPDVSFPGKKWAQQEKANAKAGISSGRGDQQLLQKVEQLQEPKQEPKIEQVSQQSVGTVSQNLVQGPALSNQQNYYNYVPSSTTPAISLAPITLQEELGGIFGNKRKTRLMQMLEDEVLYQYNPQLQEQMQQIEQKQQFGQRQMFAQGQQFGQALKFMQTQKFDQQQKHDQRQLFAQTQRFAQAQQFDQRQQFDQVQQFDQQQQFDQKQIYPPLPPELDTMGFLLPPILFGGQLDHHKKRKIPSYYSYLEISPTPTPREITGTGQKLKPFFRTINETTIEKITPRSQEFRRRGLTGADYENFASESAEAMGGLEFFRAKTKAEGGPGIARRQQNIDDVIRYIHTGNRQRKTTTPKQEKPQQEQSANGIRNFNNMVSGNIPIKRKQTNWW
jgi:hypothetical protein